MYLHYLTLETFLDDHSNVIEDLSNGFREAHPHIVDAQVPIQGLRSVPHYQAIDGISIFDQSSILFNFILDKE